MAMCWERSLGYFTIENNPTNSYYCYPTVILPLTYGAGPLVSKLSCTQIHIFPLWLKACDFFGDYTPCKGFQFN